MLRCKHNRRWILRYLIETLSDSAGQDTLAYSTRISFVGGIRGTDELKRLVDEGAAVAFSMPPTSVLDLMEVADIGEVMPPKSTWFEPKLREGVVVRALT
jgi:uncharacterized protein (DUF1015 family)